MNSLSLHLFDHLLFLIIGLVLPSISLYSSLGNKEDIKLNQKEKCTVYLGNSFILFFLAFLVLTNWYFQDRHFAYIGLVKPSDSNFTIWALLLMLFIVLYMTDAFFSLFPESRKQKTIERWRKRTYLLPASKREFYCFAILSMSAGVCEEIMFRGFLITYLYNLFGAGDFVIYLAIFIPAFLFGIAHAYQGTSAVMKVVLMAILFGLVYVFSGSIIWLIIIHVLVDVLGGLLAKEYFVKPDIN